MSGPQRRKTVLVDVGGVKVGSPCPIVVQSMTNTDTADVDATVAQVRALHAAGSELVRVTVNTEAAARAVSEIVEQVDAPVIGDFHYNGHVLLTKYPDCARALSKYRINPGNVGGKHHDENFSTIVKVAVDHGKPVRIGVNWGSLDQQLLTELMDANARLAEPLDAREVTMHAMVESALRSAELAEEIQTYLRNQMPVWKARYAGVEELRVAVMGCVVNGPGESKHADIGISLPGTFEEPKAPVFVDGALRLTLKGDTIVADFLRILDDYVERRYGARGV